MALGAALRFALVVEGYAVDLHSRAEALLEGPLPPEPICLVVDQVLPGASGIEALETLRARGVAAPAFLMTTQPSRPLRARAAAARVTILEKPVLGDQVLAAIRALRTD